MCDQVMNEYHFHIKIDAPQGLAGIEKYIHSCKMNLKIHKSGFNGKIILQSVLDEDRFDWEMDSSETNIMIASGDFFIELAEAKELLDSFSYILSIGGFRHRWGIDDETGNVKYEGQFKWD